MTKLLIAALSLSAMGYLAYRTMYGQAAVVDESGVSAPKQRLENVQNAARRIEGQQDQRAADADKAAADP